MAEILQTVFLAAAVSMDGQWSLVQERIYCEALPRDKKTLEAIRLGPPTDLRDMARAKIAEILIARLAGARTGVIGADQDLLLTMLEITTASGVQFLPASDKGYPVARLGLEALRVAQVRLGGVVHATEFVGLVRGASHNRLMFLTHPSVAQWAAIGQSNGVIPPEAEIEKISAERLQVFEKWAGVEMFPPIPQPDPRVINMRQRVAMAFA